MTLTNTANPPPTPPGLLSAPTNPATSDHDALEDEAQAYNRTPDAESLNPPTSSGGSR